jgi:RNA polymerase sigma factor (sigma-70 family)
MPTLPNPAPLAGLALRCQSDSRLAALTREGQTRAFEEIVRRYRGSLVSFAGAIVPTHRAEDVVQEALTKAHASLVASDTEIKLKPWLYTIVRNRALNDLRDEPTHEHLDESFDGVPQPPDVAAGHDELRALIAGLKDLPAAQRDALVQRELGGRSHQEIATALAATPGAVRGLIFRARTTLRDAAGMLIPMPALRALLNAGPLHAEATATGIGGATVGLTAGGGAGIAVKAGTTLAVAVLAVGSGMALDRGGSKGDANAATGAHQGGGHPNHGGAGPPGAADPSGGGGSRPGDGSSGPGSSGDEATDDKGQSGGSGSAGDDHSSDGGGELGSSSGPSGGEHHGPGGSGGADDGGSSGGPSGGGSGSSGTDGDGPSGDEGTSGDTVAPQNDGADTPPPPSNQPDG